MQSNVKLHVGVSIEMDANEMWRLRKAADYAALGYILEDEDRALARRLSAAIDDSEVKLTEVIDKLREAGIDPAIWEC